MKIKMQKENTNNVILRCIMKTHGEANVSVKGTSMEPVLIEGDVVHIVSGEYKIGDLLVFTYKYGELLIHRFVGMSGNRMLCKGDNAFRMEDIDESVILGKVDSVRHNEEIYQLPHFSEALATMSKEIGKLFKKNKYDIFVTKTEPLYKEFCFEIMEYATFRQYGIMGEGDQL